MRNFFIIFCPLFLLTIGIVSCSNDDRGAFSSNDFEKIFTQGGWEESKIYKIESSGQWTEIDKGVGFRPLRFAFTDWNLLKLYHEYDHDVLGEDGKVYFEEYDFCNYQYKDVTRELTFSNNVRFYNATYHVESISPEKLVIKGKHYYDNNMYAYEFKHVSASVVKEWNEKFIHQKEGTENKQ
ncbi:MAG: hypothetical protein IJV44_06220 [Prevotella sp.]|nr:hypothetical protein [Prevotella sp.]